MNMIIIDNNLVVCENQSNECAIEEAMEFINDLMRINKFDRTLRNITLNGTTKIQKMTFLKNGERCTINVKVVNKICLFRISIYHRVDKKCSKVVLRSPWLAYGDLADELLKGDFKAKIKTLNNSIFADNLKRLMSNRNANQLVMSFDGKGSHSVLSFISNKEIETQNITTPP